MASCRLRAAAGVLVEGAASELPGKDPAIGGAGRRRRAAGRGIRRLTARRGAVAARRGRERRCGQRRWVAAGRNGRHDAIRARKIAGRARRASETVAAPGGRRAPARPPSVGRKVVFASAKPRATRSSARGSAARSLAPRFAACARRGTLSFTAHRRSPVRGSPTSRRAAAPDRARHPWRRPRQRRSASPPGPADPVVDRAREGPRLRDPDPGPQLLPHPPRQPLVDSVGQRPDELDAVVLAGLLDLRPSIDSSGGRPPASDARVIAR